MAQTPQRALTPYETQINYFQPQTPAEQVTARVTRMMLYYHIARVQLEGAKSLNHDQSVTLKTQAIVIRRAGFREEQQAHNQGFPVAYDDELLRTEGTRIAYLIARSDLMSAMRHEEMIVATTVQKALYSGETAQISIAA